MIAGAPPEDRFQDASAVQGCARQEVEHRQETVGHTEPDQSGRHHLRPAGSVVDPGRAEAHQAAQKGRHRPDDGDPEGRRRVVGVALERGDPAQHPEGDVLDDDLVTSGHDGVRDLVREQRAQEQHGHHDADGPVLTGRVSFDGAGKHALGKDVGDQDGNDENRPMCAHHNPRDASQPHRAGHGGTDGGVGPVITRP